MKILSKPIEVIAHCSLGGVPQPIRFRLEGKEGQIVIKIDKIIEVSEEIFVGNKMYIYRCEAIINGRLRLLELKYELKTCLWYLFKL